MDAKICTVGSFVNVDSGFDSKCFQSICDKCGVIPNVAFLLYSLNKEEYLLDNLLYNQRFFIEESILGWTFIA